MSHLTPETIMRSRKSFQYRRIGTVQLLLYFEHSLLFAVVPSMFY